MVKLMGMRQQVWPIRAFVCTAVLMQHKPISLILVVLCIYGASLFDFETISIFGDLLYFWRLFLFFITIPIFGDHPYLIMMFPNFGALHCLLETVPIF